MTLEKEEEVNETTLLTEKESLKQLKESQKRDSQLAPIYKYLHNKELPTKPEIANRIVVEAQHMELDDGILYRIWIPQDRRLKEDIRRQVALPKDWRTKALEECHDSSLTGGHLGFFKTYNKIRERYWWPNFYSETKHWIDTCKECAQRKGAKPELAGKIQPIVAKEAFDIIGMDFFGPLPATKNGNEWVLSFTDHFSKYVELFALKSATEVEVANCLVKGIICRHGVMNQLISDRGSSFVSHVITEVYKVFKIHKVNTTAWHPQANGQTEKFNQVIANMLSIYCNEFQND